MHIIPHISTRFILINTLKNDNIGSAARAIKTMGFKSLHLVNPYDKNVLLQCKKTKNRASGADDIIRNAKMHSTLTEAIQSCSLVCGTGMPVDMYRKRKVREYIEPRVYFETVLYDIAHNNNKNSVDKQQQIHHLDIAFLFGCEKTGMTDEDMDNCDVMLGIPTNPMFGSLNLASAVQIIAYDWRMALGGRSSYDIHV
jgi:tRNA/rRNA methyltransferase